MLYSIFSLILNLLASILAGACLLRLYMQWQRTPFSNPVGQFVMAVSNWLVIPLRRILPSSGRVDLASLLGAYLISLAQATLLWFVAPAAVLRGASVSMLLLVAVFNLAQLLISSLVGLVIVYAVVSWIQPRSPLYTTLDRLCRPMLSPIRRHVPLVGGVDLSPLIAMVVLQAGLIALQHLQVSLY
jgi:YggT family protein